MPRNQREEVEATDVQAEVEATAKLKFVVKTNRLHGFEVGQVVEFDKDELRPEWLQHLEPTE
jgi:hypothetical protein